jgi:hypothetical protein
MPSVVILSVVMLSVIIIFSGIMLSVVMLISFVWVCPVMTECNNDEPNYTEWYPPCSQCHWYIMMNIIMLNNHHTEYHNAERCNADCHHAARSGTLVTGLLIWIMPNVHHKSNCICFN